MGVKFHVFTHIQPMKTQPSAFIIKLQRRVAQVAIGPSALRNQGAKDMIPVARAVAEEIDLAEFGRANATRFKTLLDESTHCTITRFPTAAKNWGAARKAMNLFLRDALYNHELAAQYGLLKLRHWLELPLDKDAATGLKGEPEGVLLPKWDRIKNLTADLSREYQAVATEVAFRKRVARVDLDVFFWRPKKA